MKQVWQANDGTIFDSMEKCSVHEQYLNQVGQLTSMLDGADFWYYDEDIDGYILEASSRDLLAKYIVTYFNGIKQIMETKNEI